MIQSSGEGRQSGIIKTAPQLADGLEPIGLGVICRHQKGTVYPAPPPSAMESTYDDQIDGVVHLGAVLLLVLDPEETS